MAPLGGERGQSKERNRNGANIGRAGEQMVNPLAPLKLPASYCVADFPKKIPYRVLRPNQLGFCDGSRRNAAIPSFLIVSIA